MYFDDFEIDLNLSNSFDAIVQDELGQDINVEPDIEVTIPQARLPTKAQLEEWERIGYPEWVVTGPPGTQPLHPERYAQPFGTRVPGTPFGTTVPETTIPTVIIPQTQQTSPVTSNLAALQRRELVDDIVKDLTERLLPRLKKIDKRLKLAAAQRKATDEHNIIMEREKFRQEVILELKHLSQLLPINHPIRTTIEAL